MGLKQGWQISGLCRLLAAAVLSIPFWVSPLCAQEAAASRLLDAFEDLSPWQALASDGVKSSAQLVEGRQGRAMRLDFDFARVGGYAYVRRALPLDLPANYEISFWMRAGAPANNLEFKLTDASGDNVWWHHRPNYEFPREWQQIKIKKRQIEFAWGPAKDKTLKHADKLEFVVSAGKGGGHGSIIIDQLSIRELPPDPTNPPRPLGQASSSQTGSEPSLALDGQPATAWQSDPADGAEQSLIIDLGQPREFGGLVLHWLKDAFAARYDVEFSDDGVAWRTVRRVVAGNGRRDALMLPESESRFVRLALHDGPAHRYGLAEAEIKELAFGATPNAFFQELARDARRGTYPRGFSGEQPYWTIIGTDGGSDSGLLSEDGALEIGKGGFSVEPFVVSGGDLTTWADVQIRHSLLDNYLPIPSVTWRHPQWEMRVTSFAAGDSARTRLMASYELENLTGRPLSLQLVLAVRPFQVNPPAQFLNTPGGVSPIRDLRWDGAELTVNGERKLFPLSRPDAVGAFTFDGGGVPEQLTVREGGAPQAVHDDVGYASGALVYRITLAPRASTSVGLVAPLTGAAARPAVQGKSASRWLARQQADVAQAWRAKLNKVSLRVPAQGQPVVDSIRSSLAHMLMTRDGAALQPGTRSYARSWIRDGAMISEALLRLGHEQIVADYLRWFAPRQFANGKVPCCVDKRGADPVPENDSHGQLIFLAAEHYRYTHDRALLADAWPHVEAAASYMETLRQSERTVANLAPENRALYGLMPASISHEGYSEKPMYSYWDDFWALKGYKDAVSIANALGRDDDGQRFAGQRDEFSQDLHASLLAAADKHGIPYLPGAAELGDFDATSTTIALSPGGEQQNLPQDLLHGTFERYWRFVVERREGGREWKDYTPYEWRTVGTFIRLGWRERAEYLMDFFMADRHPAAWNQWAEVVGRDRRQPRFIGDLPHAWVGSDFVRSALDMFAYERAEDQALVLGAGIPVTWLEGQGIAVRNLRTAYGPLSYSLRKTGKRLVLEVAKGSALPPGGLVLPWPGDWPPRSAYINGKKASWQDTELHIGELPARVVVDMEKSHTPAVMSGKPVNE